MPTTTNYGWTTPADTDLVKDGAAAIRTLGSSVDTTTKALNPSTTLGDIEYRSSTANTNTRLGIGTSGQILSVSGGVPAWTTPASAAPTSANSTVSTQQTTTSGSYAALGTAQAVTLTTGTKVLVLLTAETSADNAGNQYMSFAISGATTLAASDANALFNVIASNVSDQPARTSSANFVTVTAGSNTFTAQFRQSGGNAKFANRQITVIDLGS
jgi:hypothetical protein